MKLFLLLTVAAALSAACPAAAPRALTVERVDSPVGVDAEAPRLSWKLPAGVKAQRAYEIEGYRWKTGKVLSSDTIDIPWGGPVLGTSRRVGWRVRIWDENGKVSDWSEPAYFTMGVTRPEDWKAKWIGPHPATRPAMDFASAAWATGFTNRLSFVWNGADEPCELVWAATRPNRIYVNGERLFISEGQLYDFRHLSFVDIRHLLKKGGNEILLDLAPFHSYFHIDEVRPPEAVAVLATVRQGDRLLVGTTGKDGPSQPAFAQEIDFREELCSPAFAKRFTVAKTVRRAVLHVTGVGSYEAFLNGVRIGEKVLDPSPTDYSKRVPYSTYELDGVKPGENELKVLVGHGWYDVRSIATWNFNNAPWRSFPRMIAQLELQYADGTKAFVVSDGSWRHVESPVAYDCIREGEVVGGNRERSAKFVGLPAVEVAGPGGRLVGSPYPATKVVRRIRPSAIKDVGNGDWFVAFPGNLGGWAKIRFRGLSKGDRVTIRYDENVAPGNLPTVSTEGVPRKDFNVQHRLIDIYFRHGASQRFTGVRGAFQTDHYISDGTGEDVYEPRFTYNGFHYLLLSGLKEAPRAEDIEACAIRTDFALTGDFESSDATLNALVQMARNSYLVNFSNGFPTDCAHREKLGWFNDGWMSSELAFWHFENTANYEKWVQDIVDTQLPDGRICSIAPTGGWGYQEYIGPTCDLILGALPWNLWSYRRDRKAVELAYPAYEKLLSSLISRESDPDLCDIGLGDWNAINAEHMPSREYVASCGYYHMKLLAAKMAAVCGNADSAEFFTRSAEKTRLSILAKFYRGKGVFDNGGQTAQALAINLRLVPDPERAAVARQLVASVEKTDFHPDFGLVGTKQLFRALSDIGRGDLALKTLLNPTQPSMVPWLETETTLHEDFGIALSKSHVMFGDFAAWVMQYLAGLRLPGTPLIADADAAGFAKVIVAPDARCGLSWVKASTETPRGRLAVAWKIEKGRFQMRVEIPQTTEAEVRLPDGTVRQVAGGVCDFDCSVKD